MNEDNEKLNDQLKPVENPTIPVENLIDSAASNEVKEEPIVQEVETLHDVNVSDNSPLVSEVVLPDSVNSNNPAISPLPSDTFQAVDVNSKKEVPNEEPVAVEPVKTDDVVDTKEQNEKPQTKANIVIIAALVVLLFVAAFVFILPNINGKKSNSENKDSGKEAVVDDSQNANTSNVKINDFNGVYEYNNAVVTLFAISEEDVYVSVDTDSYYYSNYLNFGNGKIKSSDLNIELTSNDAIEIKSSDEGILSGTYKKTGDYAAADYFKDNFGDASKYLNSKYNGQYELNDYVMYIMQLDEKTTRVLIQKKKGIGLSYSNLEYEIVSDNKLHEKLFDDEYEITLSGDTAKFVTVKGDKEYDGTYKKVKSLTQEDIIKNFQ